ncbi:MAG TPA: MaoC/PaaZ C-terminal domain-containing protein [Mycobacterium sp.]
MSGASAFHEGGAASQIQIEPISRTTLALFAGASGDHNPIHVDLDVAEAAGFDDVFAHGMLSMGYLGRLLTTIAPQERLRSYSTRFIALTPIHAAPTCTMTTVAVDDINGERQATLDLAVTLSDGTVTLRGTAVIAIP